MPRITRSIPSFELAFGAEDGVNFCALIWPLAEGEIPFTKPPHIQNHLDGFVLFDEEQSLVVGCFGVMPDDLKKMETAHLVILRKTGQTYEQMAISALSDSNLIRLTD